MQSLILLVWQRGTAQSRGVRPPRYCGNTEQDKTQNLWYRYVNEKKANSLLKQKCKNVKNGQMGAGRINNGSF